MKNRFFSDKILTMPARADLASNFRICCNDMCTCCSSCGSSTTNSWAKMSPIFGICSFVSLHSNGKSRMAWRRIWMFSSSHKSSDASIAESAKFGKNLKNFPINCDAKRFSFSDPFTASMISRYSFSCCTRENKKKNKSAYMY